jgi:hypothetical protein
MSDLSVRYPYVISDGPGVMNDADITTKQVAESLMSHWAVSMDL